MKKDNFLAELSSIIESRKTSAPESSYTASLLNKGSHKCAKKFGEEAYEFGLALVSEGDEEVKGEAADVIYHLLVALAARDIPFDAVIETLKARTHQSGLQEKAGRGM